MKEKKPSDFYQKLEVITIYFFEEQLDEAWQQQSFPSDLNDNLTREQNHGAI